MRMSKESGPVRWKVPGRCFVPSGGVNSPLWMTQHVTVAAQPKNVAELPRSGGVIHFLKAE